MNILILGSGGREHALAWKIKQSPKCNKIFIAPGNGGTGKVGVNINLNPNNFESVANALKKHKINMLIVGSEEPLVNGIVDYLKADNYLKALKIIGPSSKGAHLEGSKEYAKKFMKKYEIPTATAQIVTKANIEDTIKYMDSISPPYVLKADGLAGGKGVIITEDLKEAKKTLQDLIEGKKFGPASEKVLLEQFLTGIEVSFFILTDGKDYRILPEAKDYKRIGEKDTGLNTGGMGAVSPVIFADRIFKEKVNTKIIKPTIKGLRDEKIDYCGFLFFGIINVVGEPYLIEYNVRLGDPETEVILPRIKTDFLDLLSATANKQLVDTEIEYERFTAATVMYVSQGYPENYKKGYNITPGKSKNVLNFHAGTEIQDNKLITNGGRVIALTGLGNNLGEALSKIYLAGDEWDWHGKNYRQDIGSDLKDRGQ